MPQIQIKTGHVLKKLREMPDKSVHCVITSPPYWNLRDYGSDPQVWGGDDCRHEWDDLGRTKKSSNYNEGFNERYGNEPDAKKQEASSVGGVPNGQICTKCDAWKGELGHESTVEHYISHLMMVFDEIWRVLRDDGVCFVNIGDTYSANRSYQAIDNKHTNVGNNLRMKAPGINTGLALIQSGNNTQLIPSSVH